MIQVNLLPPEYRKVEGTPVARLVAVLAGVFITATAVSVWGYVHFAILAKEQTKRAQMEEELVSLQALATRSQALLTEFKEYQARRGTIESIGKSRVLWSKKLDEFADVVHNKGDKKRHLVWFSGVRTGAPRGPGSAGVLSVDGWSGGDYTRLADFSEDVQKSEFFEDFMSIDPPRGELVQFQDALDPNTAWKFAAKLDLKESGWREKQ